MLSVNVNESFYLTVVLVDDDSMGSGENVSFTVLDNADNVILSGTLDESPQFSGTYSKEISLPSPGDFRAYYTVQGYPTGIEYIKVEQESLADLIKQNRQTNMSVENVLATQDIPNRNVAVGRTDYVIIRIKRDSDTNWDSPITTRRLYAWYAQMGDDQPVYMGEESR